MLKSLVIALLVLFGVVFALASQSGFDLRAKAKKAKTEGEIKKELRTKSSEDDCSSSGGQWIGKKKGGFCRPMTEDEVKKAQARPLNPTSPSPGGSAGPSAGGSAGPSAGGSSGSNGSNGAAGPSTDSVRNYINSYGWPVGTQ
jgi:hypothetical protein